jgi:hypothetical protein
MANTSKSSSWATPTEYPSTFSRKAKSVTSYTSPSANDPPPPLPNGPLSDTQVSVSLANPLPTAEFPDEDEEGLENTPSHLNPRFLLGSSADPRGEISQLYAVQIATLVLKQNPQERRTLLVGVGMKGKIASDYESEEARALILAVLELVGENRVW